MVNTVPKSWQYTLEMENLFFFFQCSEELLSNSSPDTFRLPVCNSMILCAELRSIYHFLADSKQIERYYSKYIPCIIDELIACIQQDFILKHALGQRLESVIVGLTSAKEVPAELIRWLNILKQTCTIAEHKQKCEEQIIQDVKAGNKKKELFWLTQNYYSDLVALGYSLEHLYQSVIRFFDNYHNLIQSTNVIVSFLELFNCAESEYEFLVVADTYRIGNLSRIDPDFNNDFHIQEVNETKLNELKAVHRSAQRLYETYQNMKSRGDPNIKILSCKATSIDPYSAFDRISRAFDLAQCLEGYFKHKTESRCFFDILLIKETELVPIKMRRIIPSRPFIEQAVIDKRIETIMNAESCHINVVMSLFKAMDMHLDAINCKSEETMLRSFWTALEALFFTSDESEGKENVKYCILHIIQKTYLLKQFRLIFEQLKIAIDDQTYWETIKASSFRDFILSFMSIKASDPEFRNFTNSLQNNPLLRSRLFWLKKEVDDPKGILRKIEGHFEKVSWQIDRIYRTRNLITHAGVSMPYINEILFNTHNYFDYVINYIICKLENKSYIQSIASMVFEAKNDNQLHLSYLKKLDCLTTENYLTALFGPDLSIVSFEFEAIIRSELLSE